MNRREALKVAGVAAMVVTVGAVKVLKEKASCNLHGIWTATVTL